MSNSESESPAGASQKDGKPRATPEQQKAIDWARALLSDLPNEQAALDRRKDFRPYLSTGALPPENDARSLQYLKEAFENLGLEKAVEGWPAYATESSDPLGAYVLAKRILFLTRNLAQ